MIKKITFSTDEELIRKARERAASQEITLDEAFRVWLRKYAEQSESVEDFARLMGHLSYAKPGRKFSRDEMNER